MEGRIAEYVEADATGWSLVSRGQSRFYSQFLAFQLKARLEGIPTPV
jgi:hypothetical protein